MNKSNFIELLKRDSANEILDFLLKKGKKPKSIDPLIFNKDTKSDTNKK